MSWKVSVVVRNVFVVERMNIMVVEDGLLCDGWGCCV